MDLDEIGPAESVIKKNTQRQVRSTMSRHCPPPQVGFSASNKLVLQLLICFVVSLMHSGKGKQLYYWLRPLPPCPEPQWWQAPLPSSWKPGADGECRLE